MSVPSIYSSLIWDFEYHAKELRKTISAMKGSDDEELMQEGKSCQDMLTQLDAIQERLMDMRLRRSPPLRLPPLPGTWGAEPGPEQPQPEPPRAAVLMPAAQPEPEPE